MRNRCNLRGNFCALGTRYPSISEDKHEQDPIQAAASDGRLCRGGDAAALRRGHGRSPGARGAAQLLQRPGQFLAGRRRRVGAGHAEPAADHRRPPLGRRGRPRRTAGREHRPSSGCVDQRERAESRRSRDAARAHPRLAVRPRVADRSWRHGGNRYAESRIHRQQRRPLSHRRRCRRQRHDARSVGRTR